jgi:hypothetical protein
MRCLICLLRHITYLLRQIKCLPRQMKCHERHFEILNQVVIMCLSIEGGETDQISPERNDLSQETDSFDWDTNPFAREHIGSSVGT